MKKLIFLLFIFFSVETWIVDVLDLISDKSYEGLSTVGFLGSQNGYSIVNFILLYFIGAYIHINFEKVMKVSKGKIVTWLLLDFIIMYSLVIIGKRCGMDFALFNYNSPLIIVFAVLIFCFFLQMDFSSKKINTCAKASFTCYIVHGNFLPVLGIQWAVSASVFELILHQIIVVTVLYFISYIVYVLYTIISRPLFHRMHFYISKVKLYEDISY